MAAKDRGEEAGESLLEILMAVAIIGIAFAAVLAGLGTAVAVSGVNEQQATDTNYVRSVAESLEAAPFPTCAEVAAGAYDTALSTLTPPTGFNRSLTVAYWNGATFGSACLPITQLHRITVSTEPADDRAAAPQPLEVLKRKP